MIDLESIDTLIIGAGVIGLAIGAKLSKTQRVIVIEQNAHFGEHTSSRNSEVIHAGLYYPKHSKKAQLCVKGKQLLYQHCEQFNIPHQQLGKLLIATNQVEEEKLVSIKQHANANGVDDLYWLTKQQIEQSAPQINAVSALFSPSTGILDSHQLMLSFITQIEQNQDIYIGNTRFLSAKRAQHGFSVELDCDGQRMQLVCKNLINAAGLFAQHVAKEIEGLTPCYIPPLYFCRGQYFSYQGKHPFKHLVYPVPEKHGLGIHATLDMAGQLKFGPDTCFIEKLDYQIDENAKSKFVTAIKRYWPTLDESKLHADYAGIRPKLQLDGPQDFIIQTDYTHGVKGLINLFGIESPGLTASMAIANEVLAGLEHRV